MMILKALKPIKTARGVVSPGQVFSTHRVAGLSLLRARKAEVVKTQKNQNPETAVIDCPTCGDLKRWVEAHPDWSKREMAERLGCSTTYLYKFLNADPDTPLQGVILDGYKKETT